MTRTIMSTPRLVARVWARVRSRCRGDAGMNTAEYAVGTLAAVATFVGSIQLLSGSNAMVLRIGAALAIIAIWILAIWALSTVDAGSTVVVVSAIVGCIEPAVVLGLSLSPSISQWFAKKKAFKEAGYQED